MQRYHPICLLVGVVLLAGCGYGKVSPTTYELAKSLYNISNRQLSDKIDDALHLIEAARAENKISEQESQWLHAIVEQAKEGQWDQAMNAARDIMEDQIVY